MKPLVIYHANCTDGFGAAFAAWLKFGDEAEYIPMSYNQALPEQLHSPVGLELYILDFSFRRDQMDTFFKYAKRVVWLDHHKTAFETWLDGLTYSVLDPNEVVVGSPPAVGQVKEAYRNTDKMYVRLHADKSGALLAWEYFHTSTEVPMLIKHIDDRDRWQFKMNGSRELHAVLASLKPWSFEQWDRILAETSYRANDGTGIDALYRDGAVLLRAHKQQVKSALKQAAKCRIEFNEQMVSSSDQPDPIRFYEFRIGLAANAPFDLASTLGHELSKKSGTFGLVWSMAGDGQIHCSLRSNGDYDVSTIAKAFGGGGHRNAAGFSVKIETLLEGLK